VSSSGRIVACIGLLAAAVAHAQGGPPMITDDPGTPGDGHWEINIAALSDHTDGVDTYQLPLLDLNYGVGDRVQLKFEIPWIVQRNAGGSRDGSGNGLAGVKWRFFDAGEDGWQMSMYPQVEFNPPKSLAPRRGLADAGTSWLLPMEFQHRLGDVDVNFEVGRWLRPESLPDTWIAGVVVGHEVYKGFELLVELHDETAVHGGSEVIANFGARWDFSERYTLLLSAGRDVHDGLIHDSVIHDSRGATNTLLTYTGLQIRL
jgi:hypothetical protein